MIFAPCRKLLSKEMTSHLDPYCKGKAVLFEQKYPRRVKKLVRRFLCCIQLYLVNSYTPRASPSFAIVNDEIIEREDEMLYIIWTENF